MYLEMLDFKGQAVIWLVSVCSLLDHEVSARCTPGAPPESDLRCPTGGRGSNMPTVTLTAKSALAFPPGERGARIDYWDQKVAGLVLRVPARRGRTARGTE